LVDDEKLDRKQKALIEACSQSIKLKKLMNDQLVALNECEVLKQRFAPTLEILNWIYYESGEGRNTRRQIKHFENMIRPESSTCSTHHSVVPQLRRKSRKARGVQSSDWQ
jgi:hypothetical protein